MMAEMARWKSINIDYVLAFSQAPIDIDSYLHLPSGFHVYVTITMSQPTIIDKILNSLGICDESKIQDTPANFILTKYEDGNGRNQEFHYRSVIGQIYYISGTTRPYIIFAVHQCANYSMDLEQSYEESVKKLNII